MGHIMKTSRGLIYYDPKDSPLDDAPAAVFPEEPNKPNSRTRRKMYMRKLVCC